MLTQSQMEALGLTAERIGERNPVPRLDVGLASGTPLASAVKAPPVGALVEGGYEGFSFVDVEVPVARRHGARVQRMREEPCVLRVLFEGGGLDRVLTETGNGRGKVYALDAADPDLVVVDMRPGRAVLLLVPGGGGLTVEPGGGADAEIGEVLGRTIDVPQLAELTSPVAEWAASYGDAWLSAEVERRLASGDPWQHAVALGVYARLPEPSGDARAAVAGLLEGRETPVTREMERPIDWIRAAGSEVVETIADLAVAEGDRLLREMDDLQRYPPSFADVPREVLHICQWRDDLEGVRDLLSAAGAVVELAGILELVDLAGAALLERFRPVPPLEDERLDRVAGANPLLWWTLVVQTPDEAWEAEFGDDEGHV